jgi:hypothetical protein
MKWQWSRATTQTTCAINAFGGRAQATSVPDTGQVADGTEEQVGPGLKSADGVKRPAPSEYVEQLTEERFAFEAGIFTGEDVPDRACRVPKPRDRDTPLAEDSVDATKSPAGCVSPAGILRRLAPMLCWLSAVSLSGRRAVAA